MDGHGSVCVHWNGHCSIYIKKGMIQYVDSEMGVIQYVDSEMGVVQYVDSEMGIVNM